LSIRAVAVPEILRKIKLSICMKVFVRNNSTARACFRDFVYLFALRNFSNAIILITIFTDLFSEPYLKHFNFSGCNFKVSMRENSVNICRESNFPI
jgi:hypothetical protein